MSQCKRVEVYSWQNKSDVHYTYLDFDEVLENKEQYCKPVEKKDLPKKISACLKNKNKILLLFFTNQTYNFRYDYRAMVRK